MICGKEVKQTSSELSYTKYNDAVTYKRIGRLDEAMQNCRENAGTRNSDRAVVLSYLDLLCEI